MAEAATLHPAIPGSTSDLAVQLLHRADAAGLKLAAAESCTGGLLASLLTDVEGFGHCFDRGFVCYSEDSKCEQLGVSPRLIAEHDAVSKSVAIAMAEGALQRSGADIAVAVTGFAGRGGEGDEPGLVHFACARRSGATWHLEEHFGDIGRGEVRLKTIDRALKLMLDVVGQPGGSARLAGKLLR
ncbi:CinA family protein [Sphingomonas xanthus]|uniref:CinA family protein n=1 Tax=Sphingomonas xanthus TaxID=2594473 RepID=A0A516ISN8_9SPHN|nr:CinA family protein [Sphingomonas xanthus]QDP19932.1 CinA family protein [Sphingomonas xanthus]